MAKAGIPSFSIGTSVNFSGDINFNASYRGQEVFNSEYVDRSNADQVVNKEVAWERGLFRGDWSGFPKAIGRFPLDEKVTSYLEFPGRFGDTRGNGSRKHAGGDLYAPVGANVYAVQDGTVIQSPYAFNTKFDFAIEINHGGFIGRYCEINIVGGLHSGSIITQGQLIGTIAKMPGYKQTMLHFEMYSGNATGPLTNKANPPYMRRSDLIDPTHFLNFGY